MASQAKSGLLVFKKFRQFGLMGRVTRTATARFDRLMDYVGLTTPFFVALEAKVNRFRY